MCRFITESEENSVKATQIIKSHLVDHGFHYNNIVEFIRLQEANGAHHAVTLLALVKAVVSAPPPATSRAFDQLKNANGAFPPEDLEGLWPRLLIQIAVIDGKASVEEWFR